jgi:cell division protein FtsQ
LDGGGRIVFALRSDSGRAAGGRVGDGLDRFVLPRRLRRPVRLLRRLGTGDFVPPRYAATMATALLFAATGAYGSWVGGRMPDIAQAVTSRTGFAVDQVRVIGHRETSEIDVLERLELSGWTSLVGFDVDAARDRVAALPWVQSASGRKIYPEMLEVRIQEREPFAIWQHRGDLSIIGRQGNLIVPFGGGRHAALPLVVGDGAAERAAAFVERVVRHPVLAAKVKGYVLVGGRRWNLKLSNGLTVKLPEFGADEAMAELERMEEENQLFERDVASVDLRLPDRVVVKMTTEAVKERQEAFAKALKARKAAAEKRI